MKQISFQEFYQRTKLKLTLDQLQELEPFDNFFEHAEVLFGVQFYENKIWVSIACGQGMEWMREIVRYSLKYGIEKIGFYTTPENRPVNAIAKYYGARLVKTDRPNRIFYEVHFNHRRFKTLQEAA